MTTVVSPAPPVSLLHDPAEITPAWLTDVLRRSGAICDDAEVTACRSTRFAQGAALLSRLYRARIGYDTPNAAGPATVVVKLATVDAEQHFTAELLGLYRREALVYTELRDKLPYRTPRCHLADASTDGRATTVVLEDLGRCRTVDQTVGAPWSVVVDCVDAMAAQHAAWEGDERLGELATLLWPLAHPVYPAALPLLFEPGWAVAREALGDRLDAGLVAFADRWSTECGALLRRLSERPTLLHGDWRADNLFYSGNDLVVADFQIAGVGTGAYDLAYFVSQSVAPVVRRGRDREVVERYVERLAAHGVRRSAADVWEDYRVALLVCLVYPVSSFRSWEAHNARGHALIETMFHRAADAILTTGALELR